MKERHEREEKRGKKEGKREVTSYKERRVAGYGKH